MAIQNESSALHFAIENNYIDVVDLLVKSKADVDANNKVLVHSNIMECII